MKVALVAKLQKVTDVASFLLPFLEGDAWTQYLEMDEKDQLDVKKTQDRLKEIFNEGGHMQSLAS